MGVLTTTELSRMLYADACILVIDDDQGIREALEMILNQQGYRVMTASTGGEGLKLLTEGEVCDLVLLDVMLPDMNGWTILSRVRATTALASMPIIMMTATSDEHSHIELLTAGAEDYLSKPFSFEVLMAHIQALLRRSALQSINPLTGLPGNRQVERFLQQCVRETETFWAAAYIDIDNFKAYNDCYGFLQGDEVLRATAEAVARATVGCGPTVFIGNIGGDDFLVGFSSQSPRNDESSLKEVKAILSALVSGFDQITKGFYSQEDLARGYLEAESRRGGMERYPLMSLSVAVVTNSRRLFNHPLEINNSFVSVKRKAKSLPGSVVCFDRRRK
jgi:diguanylate cyclase (GGDEF)-like protein